MTVSIDSVVNTQFSTTIDSPTGPILTIEHLMAALHGRGIDDVDIEVRGGEIPILDGSALPWHTRLQPRELPDTEMIPLQLRQEIRLGDQSAWIHAKPSHQCRLRVELDFKWLGRLHFSAPVDEWASIAGARTFGFYEDWPHLQAQGLALGASLNTTLVFQAGRVLNPDGLRFPDEVARHKWLDLFGDLALLGAPLQADIHAYRAGHTLHTALVKMILSENDFDFPVTGRTLNDSSTEHDS